MGFSVILAIDALTLSWPGLTPQCGIATAAVIREKRRDEAIQNRPALIWIAASAARSLRAMTVKADLAIHQPLSWPGLTRPSRLQTSPWITGSSPVMTKKEGQAR
jgi:hypothetical protein